MEINVLIDKELKGHLEVSWLRSVAEQALVAQGISPNVELDLFIAGGDRVQQLNQSYLGKDEPTDVMAFSMLPSKETTDLPPFISPPDGVTHLGEVIISYPQAVLQAGEHKHSIRREITILLIHGILHLLGYEDNSPELKQQMVAREKEILSDIESKS